MDNGIRKAVLYFAAFTYGVSVVCGSVDAVICYGADGHVAIEAAHEECCGHACGSQTGRVGLGRGHEHESEGSDHDCCTDIPVSSDKNKQCTFDSGNDTIAKSLAADQPTIVPPQSPSGIQPAGPFSSENPIQSILTTVILLI